MKTIDKLVIEYIEKEENRPISRHLLIDKILKDHNNINNKEILKSIRWLLVSGEIRELQNAKLVIGYKDGNVIENSNSVGIINVNSYGDGFIKNPETNESIAYINLKNVNTALDGDEVEFILFDKQSKENLNDGKVVKVINRNKLFYTATFFKDGENKWFELDNKKINQRVYVKNTSMLENGDKVVLSIIEITHQKIEAVVNKKIGNKNDLNLDILSVVYDYGVEPYFDENVLNEVNKIINIDFEKEFKLRKDLTNLNIITIDPKESKDLDDSIYVEKENDNYRLYVSIADVAHFVRPDTILDKIALERSTSIYLANGVIPMLPKILSDDLCSLNPNENKLTMTCEILFDNKGNILEHKVYESIINSKKRYAYEEVNNFFKDNYNETNSELAKMLKHSYELHKILNNKYEKRGYIDFKINEPKVILDSFGKVLDVQIYQSGEAQHMIENFMVAANEVSTLDFIKNKIDTIYRVHDKPGPLKLKNFMTDARKIGFHFDNEINNIKSHTISKWINTMNSSSNYDFNLLSKILLRTMMKAEYSKNNIGHFGLASENYTHFTSPIRRYPDIIVHRMYKMFFLRKNEYTDKQKQELLNNLNFICQQTSKLEQRAVCIERDVNAIKFAEFMETKIGEEYIGIVSHITQFGIFIELENCIEGLCRIKNINFNDYFIFDQNQNYLVGEKTNKIIDFGNKVKIKVIGANPKLKQIDFQIIELLGK